jgi:hypothetical protein
MYLSVAQLIFHPSNGKADLLKCSLTHGKDLFAGLNCYSCGQDA